MNPTPIPKKSWSASLKEILMAIRITFFHESGNQPPKKSWSESLEAIPMAIRVIFFLQAILAVWKPWPFLSVLLVYGVLVAVVYGLGLQDRIWKSVALIGTLFLKLWTIGMKAWKSKTEDSKPPNDEKTSKRIRVILILIILGLILQVVVDAITEAGLWREIQFAFGATMVLLFIFGPALYMRLQQPKTPTNKSDTETKAEGK